MGKSIKVYKSDSPVNCGPCTFINLTNLKGSKKVENELAKIGQVKPYQISLYPSFLIWGSKSKKDIGIYTQSKKVNSKMLGLMNYYEEVPDSKKREYARKIRENLDKVNKKYSNKIKSLRDPIKKISDLLETYDKVAVMLSNVYREGKNAVPHWLVIYKKEGNIFYAMDSGTKKNNGLIKLTVSQLKNSFKRNKQDGFCPQLAVVNKK